MQLLLISKDLLELSIQVVGKFSLTHTEALYLLPAKSTRPEGNNDKKLLYYSIVEYISLIGAARVGEMTR